MIDCESLTNAWQRIAETLRANTDLLTRLDQAGGDGDLGISMRSGSAAALAALKAQPFDDLGRALSRMADAFNEAAPSSLGTILSFGLKGMAGQLRGKTQASQQELAQAMQAGLALMMQRAGSKPGEKTILDAVVPAVQALEQSGQTGPSAWQAAAEAAAQGAQKTADMRAVWGRAAYQTDGGIGKLDGGAVAGSLMFEALAGMQSEDTGRAADIR